MPGMTRSTGCTSCCSPIWLPSTDITEGNSALNLIYLLGFNNRGSGGLPLAGTDERFHIVGGNDQVPTLMAEQLPSGSIQYEHKLRKIKKENSGSFKLWFQGVNQAVQCDVLVMAMPLNLIKDVDIQGFSFSPVKQMAIDSGNTSSDNCKVMLEFSDRFWDVSQTFGDPNVELVHQAARAYSDPDKFISTWEGEPGNPSSLGVLVDYNGGVEARALKNNIYHGEAHPNNVNHLIGYFSQVWPYTEAELMQKYTGKALVANWWDYPFAQGAFTSPTLGTMTTWWGVAMGTGRQYLLCRRGLRRGILVLHGRRGTFRRTRRQGNSPELLDRFKRAR